jgi:hypothetical protein
MCHVFSQKGEKFERKNNEQNKPLKYHKYFSQKKRCKVMRRSIRGSGKKSIRKIKINRIIIRNVEFKEVESILCADVSEHSVPSS